ncbi:MAG TPA: pseudouridine synthase [Mucilaginibacter sp.]
MVFKRPGNSRDDQSGRSSNRPSKGGDNSKKSFSSSRGKSSSSSDKTDNGPSKKYSSERSAEKKPFSSDRKPYGSRPGGEDKPRSSFSEGAKKSFGPKRPYSGRPTDGESPGEKKTFAPRSKPYSGRVTSDDRPPKSFGSGKSSGEDSRPPKSFSKDSSGDRKFAGAGSKPRERSGEKKFGAKPAGIGFKKREGDFKDKPYRKPEGIESSKPKYDKITVDRDAPVRTLRGRKPAEAKDSGLIRLNRYIANAGICSRRKADELILAGVVAVNGEVVAELGAKVDPLKDEIRYNGETLKREKMTYVLLNKPKDYITTTDDPQERRTVMHLVEKASRERIYPIGRLDRNTTGLLLMTNDGELADKLSHPRSNITKLYQVELNKNLTQGDLNKIQFGLELEDGPIKPDVVSYVAGGSKREIGVQIHSGKNSIVRRIFEHLGYEVVKLDRVVYANLTKKDLPRGRWRYLDEKEIIQLKHLIK